MKMKWMKKLQDRLTGLTDAITRFPLTTLFLLASAIVIAYSINAEKDQTQFILTFIVGAFLSAVCQMIYERFYSNSTSRFTLMGAAVLLSAGYYLIIKPTDSLSMEMGIRTGVALFALLIAFIWVPVIKSSITFNSSFMIAFKSFFISLFFSGIIMAGVGIILGATDLLIFSIDYKAYSHAANIIFSIFAPIYFLSLIPVYLGTHDPKKTQAEWNRKKETIDSAANCPKFLQILISYIVIPLIAVFTLIIVIYIVKNIGGDFWTDNLLEPMLVSYAITVILVYILASEIENKFTAFFRKVFPKILVPIVLFQIASSVISLNDTGITHTRYYVILFGVYAAAAGILFSILPVRKNGIIAAMLIVFAAVSIVPPVDAFTISRTSQIKILENVLVKNNMLENNKIKPKEAIPDEDKKTITKTVYYLDEMGYTKNISWLPKDFKVYEDFSETFGFKEYQEPVDEDFKQPVYVNLDPSTPISITGYDLFVQTDVNMYDKQQNQKICVIKKDEKSYTLMKNFNKNRIDIKVKSENGQELLTFNTKEIYDKFYNYQGMKEQISAEEATFTKENDLVKMTIVVQNLNIDKQNNQYDALLFVFVQIK
ncbi:MFS family permease [Bacillus sp. SORGH_AS 510]|uniref:DUF4153 domain-containing protein n=1 Tax=Bacillus sp. SORGH_AS_0510 TaxID=3041771 RepID=UPI002787AB57|nr:DUF4153 domain-containing protein [Bacillus sp. SORGH_AS_0510]MDQ1146002.1 MFS family permease [Bacillus sp. SORGH_AS_0510]